MSIYNPAHAMLIGLAIGTVLGVCAASIVWTIRSARWRLAEMRRLQDEVESERERLRQEWESLAAIVGRS